MGTDERWSAFHEWCANPPADARFLRGLWVDFLKGSGESLTLGTFSVYREADPSVAQRALEGMAHAALRARRRPVLPPRASAIA